MAWGLEWARKKRKEAAPHRRAADERASLVEPVGVGPSKSASCRSRKFGMEYKAKTGTVTFSWLRDRDWRRWYSWYETEKQRDQALEALNRKDKFYDYRPVKR